MKLTVSDNDENDNDGLIYRTNSITYSFQDSLLWAMNNEYVYEWHKE